MNKYNLIFEAVQESLNNGEITLEEAEVLNDYAYDKYVEESTRLDREIDKRITDRFLGKADDKPLLNLYGTLTKHGIDPYKRSKTHPQHVDPMNPDWTGCLSDGRLAAIIKKSEFRDRWIQKGKEEKKNKKELFAKYNNKTDYEKKREMMDNAVKSKKDENLKTHKEQMRKLNSQKTYNPVKALQNKKKREDIAKDYLNKEKYIDANKEKIRQSGLKDYYLKNKYDKKFVRKD